ncbi:MAG: folate family ECF transporter S component [Bacilli bacterium]
MKQVKKMVYAAIFVALAFVFSLFSVTFGNSMQIGITEFPIMASGFVLGPVFGSLVGLVKDFITMMRHSYPPSLFTISPILLGFIPGLASLIFAKDKLYKSAKWLFVVVFITTLLRTINNSVALYFVNGLEIKAILLLLPMKLVILTIEAVLYAIIFRTLLPIIKQHFLHE